MGSQHDFNGADEPATWADAVLVVGVLLVLVLAAWL